MCREQAEGEVQRDKVCYSKIFEEEEHRSLLSNFRFSQLFSR
jgi:hypothetical protein